MSGSFSRRYSRRAVLGGSMLAVLGSAGCAVRRHQCARSQALYRIERRQPPGELSIAQLRDAPVDHHAAGECDARGLV